MRAGVVGADVARRGAAAARAVAVLASIDRALSDIPQPFGVDAAGFSRDLAPAARAGCTGSAQSRARARSRRDAAAGRTSRQGRIAPGEPVPRRRPIEIAAGFPVRMHNRHNDFVNRAGKCPRQRREPGKMRGPVEIVGKNDRVVAPHRDAGAEAAAQLANWATASSGGMTEVSSARGYPVTVNWTTNGAMLSDGIQMRQQRPDVARPEHEAVDLSRPERDLVGSAAVGVGHDARGRLSADAGTSARKTLEYRYDSWPKRSRGDAPK